MKPRLGLPVIFHPRVPYGRQSQLFGFVTRVNPNGTVDIVTFPSNSESVHHNNIAEKSDTTQIHCWEAAEVNDAEVMEMVTSLVHRIEVLEARRGPGRPPKAEAA